MSAPPPGVGFANFLCHPVGRCPDKVALIDEHGSVTFAEADAMANRLARAFLGAGAGAGDRVALILPNAIAFIVVEMAIVKAAMVKVPLNFRFHPKEVLYALADCAPTVLVSDAEYLDRLGREGPLPASVKAVFTVGGTGGGMRYEAAVAEGDASPLETPARPADAPLLIRYTGGTTGRPKGIVHVEPALLHVHRDVIREFSVGEADIALHLGHLSHGMNFVWGAFFAMGATQVLREGFDAGRVLADIAEFGVTFVYMVPTMVRQLLETDDGGADTSSLRLFWISSAPMPVADMRAAMARHGAIFVQGHAISEAPVITTLLRPAEHVDKETRWGSRLGSCGREVSTMEMRLLDDDGADVADGAVGEMALRCTNMMKEYWRLPDETARTIRGGWVLTGDLAARDEDGYLYIVDRKKDIILTGGFNVYPKEVEDVLHQHPGVAHCGVVGVADAKWGEAIKAYVVTRPGENVSADELVELCRDNLAGYKKPRLVEFVDALPLTPVGKISRRELRALAARHGGIIDTSE